MRHAELRFAFNHQDQNWLLIRLIVELLAAMLAQPATHIN